MRLFGRRKSQADTTKAEVAQVTAPADYDAQSDLALPATDKADVVDDGLVPYAAELVPEPPSAAYDSDRDVGF